MKKKSTKEEYLVEDFKGTLDDAIILLKKIKEDNEKKIMELSIAFEERQAQ